MCFKCSHSWASKGYTKLTSVTILVQKDKIVKKQTNKKHVYPKLKKAFNLFLIHMDRPYDDID